MNTKKKKPTKIIDLYIQRKKKLQQYSTYENKEKINDL